MVAASGVTVAGLWVSPCIPVPMREDMSASQTFLARGCHRHYILTVIMIGTPRIMVDGSLGMLTVRETHTVWFAPA